MNKHILKTIQFRIFISASAMILLTILASMLLYYFTMSNNFVERYTASSYQLAKIIAGKLDQAVETTDDLQKRLLESDIVRAYALEELPNQKQGNVYLRQREFEQAVFGIAGYDYGFYHMNILTYDGWLISFGQEYNFKPIAIDTEIKEWLKPILDRNGSLYIKSVDSPKLGGQRVGISLCRSFSRHPLNEAKAIIEIQIDHISLEREIEKMLASYDNMSNRVIVFNDRMEPIFPADLTEAEIQHYTEQSDEDKVYNPLADRVEIVARSQSDYTGWTTVITTPYSALTQGTNQYLTLAALIGLAGSIIMLIIAYSIAKSISAPITRVRDSLAHLRLENLGQGEPMALQTSYNELELLSETVVMMEKRMKRSLDDYVHMRSLSIQARMMALQSQMNPHFLYNTLSIISILAEENDDMQVSEMCQHLVEMLRYAVRESQRTTLKREVEHAKHYIELMRIRFGEKIQFKIKEADGLDMIECPPMILQPLIENCVKYATPDGDLIIHVACTAQSGRWNIEVRDNGLGFSDESLKVFQEKIQDSENFEDIIAHGVSGIGLANLYIRLRLSYGDDMLFTVENTPQGAVVIVGGTVMIAEHKKEAIDES